MGHSFFSLCRDPRLWAGRKASQCRHLCRHRQAGLHPNAPGTPEGWDHSPRAALNSVSEAVWCYPQSRRVVMLTFVPCRCILSSQSAYRAAGTRKHYQPLHGICQVPSSAGLSARLALRSGYKCPDTEASWKPDKLWQTDTQCLGKQQ